MRALMVVTPLFVVLAMAAGRPIVPSSLDAAQGSSSLKVSVVRAPKSAALLVSVAVRAGGTAGLERATDWDPATVAGLHPGRITVSASDPTPGCRVVDGNPKTADLSAGRVANVTFTLDCAFTPARRIAFMKGITGDTTIWTIRPDGTDLQQLTTQFGQFPYWSPDGTRIVYQGPNDALRVMNFDGHEQRILRPRARGDHPAWSPDGTRVAFRNEELNGIDVIRIDGTGMQMLTRAPQDTFPDWSPDGQELVFSRGGVLQVMSASGGTLRALTPGNGPSWSPDGKTIAFASTGPDPSSSVQIWKINVDGSGLTRLTDIPPDCGGPAFVPDQSGILFHCPRVEHGRIWVMGLDGEAPRRIPHVPVGSAHPRESPGVAVHR